MTLFLEAEGLKLEYALRTVIDIEQRIELRDGDRIGLVGANGAGKSTLLKLLSGEIEPDEGWVRRLRPVRCIRQLEGDAELPEADAAVASAFAAREDAAYLSGGERTRRRAASALSARGAVLLADEPTTDLDRAGIETLEKYLSAYDGALLLVSHDRALLDKLVTQIWELEDGKLTAFAGNYSAYREEKLRRRSYQQFEYEQYREEQTRLRASIQGVKERASQVKLPSRMGNSEARLHKRSATESEESVHKRRKALETRLRQMKEVERPSEDPDLKMRLGACDAVTSATSLEVREMSIRFGSRVLLENASMRLPTRSHTFLLGENGCGKTTLIGRIRSGDPRVRVNPGVKLGYFGQDHALDLRLDKTALENAMERSIYDESTARTVLARLAMRGDDVFKRAEVLSGGERAKISLARLFLSDVNCLLLDEPTNHLDLYAIAALAEVLRAYAGTLLVVSHDRAFTREVATRLVFFRGRSLVPFEGSMDEYERQCARKPDEEEARTRRTLVQMRMAALAARMAAPKKGDDPEKLNAEYQALARSLRGE